MKEKNNEEEIQAIREELKNRREKKAPSNPLKTFIFLAILASALWLGNSLISGSLDGNKRSSKSAPKIEVGSKVKTENVIEFTIETNIPLPIEIMASIDLKNQNPDDVHIGTRKKIKIDKSPLVFDFNIAEAKLPSGEYQTKVTFYPKWGAKNGNELARKIQTAISGFSSIELSTSHESAERTIEFNRKQSWVMDNVAIETPWDENKFKIALGNFDELQVTNRNPKIIKVYYFPEADMTIFVNKLKKSVLTWRTGKTDTV